MNHQPTLLILGASGLLGRHLADEAVVCHERKVHLVAWKGDFARPRDCLSPSADRQGAPWHRLDLRDHAQTRRFLEGLRPTTVVNSAGLVPKVCGNRLDAILLNAALPHLVAEVITPWNGRLIHVSTDCVFSGQRGNYSETDCPDPVGIYGVTKLAGEVYAAPHLTVRTSFIGLEPAPAKGLLGWFLEQKGCVRGFRRAIWSGLTADTLAHVLLDLVARPEITGLLHVAGEAIDKAGLLSLAAEIFEKTDAVIEPVDEPVCDRSLNAARMRSLGIQVPSIQRMLEEMSRGTGFRAT